VEVTSFLTESAFLSKTPFPQHIYTRLFSNFIVNKAFRNTKEEVKKEEIKSFEFRQFLRGLLFGAIAGIIVGIILMRK
jgi:hypothetical protein